MRKVPEGARSASNHRALLGGGSHKDALRAQLERWSHLPNLKRVIISHGEIIANDAAHALGRIAKDPAA